jgi:hypothetical protein
MGFGANMSPPFRSLMTSPHNASAEATGFLRAWADVNEVGVEHSWAMVGASSRVISPSEVAGTSHVTGFARCTLSTSADAAAFLGYFSAESKFTCRLFRFSRPPGSGANVAFALKGRAEGLPFTFGQAIAPVLWWVPPIGAFSVPAILDARLEVDPNRSEEEVYFVTVTVDSFAGGAAVGGGALANGFGDISFFGVSSRL